MITSRVNKIFCLSFLIFIRQLWSFFCNVYLLYYQPYLTLKKIRQTRDKSQFLLISLAAFAPVFIYLLSRILWDHYRYGRLLPSVGSVFFSVALIQAAVLLYLAYWTLQVIAKEPK
jgi:hypothetical protein